MTAEIDETTGLPVLPDGHFWRVRPYTKGCLQVQLRRRRWLGSTMVYYELALVDRPRWGTPVEQVRKAARDVMRRPNVKHLIGDYPPKRLQP